MTILTAKGVGSRSHVGVCQLSKLTQIVMYGFGLNLQERLEICHRIDHYNLGVIMNGGPVNQNLGGGICWALHVFFYLSHQVLQFKRLLLHL